MIRKVLWGILLLCSMSLSAQKITLKVMSINLRMSGSADGYKMDKFIEFINEHKPDLVALQEVDYRTSRVSNREIVSELGAGTGMFHLMSVARYYGGGGYGPALLSKYPFYDFQNVVRNPSGSLEPRSAAIVEIMLPNKRKIRFGATHMDTKGVEVQVPLVAAINNIMITPNDLPCILMGDFNATPEQSTIKEAMRNWLDFGAVDNLPTFPNPNPTSRIDYIFGYPKTWVLKEFKRFDGVLTVSDHCAIMATIELE